MVVLAVLEHPFSSVTSTVYVLVLVGATVMSCPCCPDIGQEYCMPVAEKAKRETLSPLQMLLLALMVTSGSGFTMTVSDVVAEHPCALVTVTK